MLYEVQEISVMYDVTMGTVVDWAELHELEQVSERYVFSDDDRRAFEAWLEDGVAGDEREATEAVEGEEVDDDEEEADEEVDDEEEDDDDEGFVGELDEA